MTDANGLAPLVMGVGLAVLTTSHAPGSTDEDGRRKAELFTMAVQLIGFALVAVALSVVGWYVENEHKVARSDLRIENWLIGSLAFLMVVMVIRNAWIGFSRSGPVGNGMVYRSWLLLAPRRRIRPRSLPLLGGQPREDATCGPALTAGQRCSGQIQRLDSRDAHHLYHATPLADRRMANPSPRAAPSLRCRLPRASCRPGSHILRATPSRRFGCHGETGAGGGAWGGADGESLVSGGAFTRARNT